MSYDTWLESAYQANEAEAERLEQLTEIVAEQQEWQCECPATEEAIKNDEAGPELRIEWTEYSSWQQRGYGGEDGKYTVTCTACGSSWNSSYSYDNIDL